jgi:SPP1 gp7 family putative phage head morphogenesis protein
MAEGEYRNLNNQEYWAKRTEEKQDKQWKKIENVEKAVAEQYRLAQNDIRQSVIDLFTKYGTEQGLTYQEAVKELTSNEVRDYKAQLERLVPAIRETKNSMLIAELEKFRAVNNLTRFQALMAQLEIRLNQLGYEQQMSMEEALSGVYEGTYYQTIYALQVGTGVGVAFTLMNHEAIQEAITFPWANEQFSERIWSNKTLLVKELRQTITEGFIKGHSNQKMARSLAKKMDSNYSNALRLIRTEGAYVMSEATNKGYKASGIVKQYQYVASLREKTCEICRKLDGKIFNVDEKLSGTNASPMHPNCSCTEVVYFGEDSLKESQRIAKVEGETYYVPANITFEEFESTYIKRGVPTT